jgi:hypothetical protein
MGNYDDGVGFDRDDCGMRVPERRRKDTRPAVAHVDARAEDTGK